MDLEVIVDKYKNSKEDKYFTKIYNETIGLVKSILYTYSNDKATIEDLSQDVYMKLVKNIDSYNTKNFRNYIYQIAKTTGIDYVRKTHELTNLDYDYIPSEAKNPYLNFALSHLDKDLKEIFLMKTLLGYTTKKVAEVLNLTPKMVNYAYEKARKQLRKELEGVEDEIK